MKKKFLLKFCGHSVTSFHILFSGSSIGSTPKERKSKIDFGHLCRWQKIMVTDFHGIANTSALSRWHHGINVVRMVFWILGQEFSSIYNFFANAARSCMHNPFTVVLFISFNSDWPFNGATLVFYLCTFKETIWDFEATEYFGFFFYFFWNLNLKINKSLVEIYKAILKLNKGSSFGTRQSTRRRATRSERSDNYLPIRWRFWQLIRDWFTGLDVPERFFHLTLS